MMHGTTNIKRLSVTLFVHCLSCFCISTSGLISKLSLDNQYIALCHSLPLPQKKPVLLQLPTYFIVSFPDQILGANILSKYLLRSHFIHASEFVI